MNEQPWKAGISVAALRLWSLVLHCSPRNLGAKFWDKRTNTGCIPIISWQHHSCVSAPMPLVTRNSFPQQDVMLCLERSLGFSFLQRISILCAVTAQNFSQASGRLYRPPDTNSSLAYRQTVVCPLETCRGDFPFYDLMPIYPLFGRHTMKTGNPMSHGKGHFHEQRLT